MRAIFGTLIGAAAGTGLLGLAPSAGAEAPHPAVKLTPEQSHAVKEIASMAAKGQRKEHIEARVKQNLQLQQLMQKQQQAIQTLSNISKGQHHTTKAVIQNSK